MFFFSILEWIYYLYIFNNCTLSLWSEILKDHLGTEKFGVMDAYYLREIVNRAKSDKNTLIPPSVGHEEGPLVPYGPDMVSEVPRCRNVIVGRGYWHLHHLADL